MGDSDQWLSQSTELQHLHYTSRISTNPSLVLIITINLLTFYHECRSLIGYISHYSVIDSDFGLLLQQHKS